MNITTPDDFNGRESQLMLEDLATAVLREASAPGVVTHLK